MIDCLRIVGLVSQGASLCTVWTMLHHLTVKIVMLVGRDAQDRPLWTDNHCLALTWLIMSWKALKLSLHYCQSAVHWRAHGACMRVTSIDVGMMADHGKSIWPTALRSSSSSSYSIIKLASCIDFSSFKSTGSVQLCACAILHTCDEFAHSSMATLGSLI